MKLLLALTLILSSSITLADEKDQFIQMLAGNHIQDHEIKTTKQALNAEKQIPEKYKKKFLKQNLKVLNSFYTNLRAKLKKNFKIEQLKKIVDYKSDKVTAKLLKISKTHRAQMQQYIQSHKLADLNKKKLSQYRAIDKVVNIEASMKKQIKQIKNLYMQRLIKANKDGKLNLKQIGDNLSKQFDGQATLGMYYTYEQFEDSELKKLSKIYNDKDYKKFTSLTSSLHEKRMNESLAISKKIQDQLVDEEYKKHQNKAKKK